jgi:hypothetical protein
MGVIVGGSKAKMPELDELDSGWEEDEEEDEALDAGWEDPEGADEPEPPGMTLEEREARAARAAVRKERLRAKAAEKAERRKARASAAAAKQKKSAPRTVAAPPRTRPEPRAPHRSEESRSEEPTGDDAVEEQATPRAPEQAPLNSYRAAGPAFDWRRVAPFVVILVAAVGVALYLWKR